MKMVRPLAQAVHPRFKSEVYMVTNRVQGTLVDMATESWGIR